MTAAGFDLSSADQILSWAFRGLGVLYAIGGALVVNNVRAMLFLARSVERLEQMMREAGQPSLLANDPEDRGRLRWLMAGGVLTFVSGLAMIAATHLCLYFLMILLTHQALYLMRQHGRIQAARNAAQEEEAAPAPSTWRAFCWMFPILAIAFYLSYRGVLT